MTPEDCPRYESCSAPVCPFDDRWRFRHYGRGEAVCGLMLEAVKPNGSATLRSVIGDAAETILQAAPEMAHRFPFIAHRLNRAAAQGSRIRSARAARKGGQRSAANVA